MKAIWKGYVKCSLVTIPVKMYNAVHRKTLQFDLLHKQCGTRIRQERLCPLCHKSLAPEDLTRGFRYGKAMYVEISDADIQKAQKESSDTIEIVKFIHQAEIHPVYYADSHYLVADGKAGLEAFALFHQAMRETNQTALARLIWRNREHLLAIRPYDGAMIAFTLHYPEELYQVEQLEEAAETGKVSIEPRSLELAKTIIQQLSGDFVPQEYVDEYTQTLLAIIRAKAQGEEFTPAVPAEREKVINLMDALQRSLQAVTPAGELPKKAMAAAGRRPAREKKTRQQG